MMDELASITRATVSQNEEGDTERVFEEVASDVPCSVQRGSGSRRTEDGGYVRVETWRGFFLPGVDIQIGDRVVTDKTTQVYEVAGLDYIRNHFEVQLRAVAGA